MGRPPRDALVVGALRSAYGRRGGALGSWHPVDLAAYVLSALLSRSDVDGGTVDDVVLGCVSQVGAQACNIARYVALAAGWAERVPGTTVDRQAASSAQAVHWAAQAVMSGAQDLVVAGGVEMMSTVPLGASLALASVGKPYGPGLRRRYQHAGGLVPPGLAAEQVAKDWALGREQLDGWALTSHERAARSQRVTPGYMLAVPTDPRAAGNRAGPPASDAVPRTGRGAPLSAHATPAKPKRPPAPAAAAVRAEDGLLTKDELVGVGLRAKDVSAFAPLFEDGGLSTAANVAAEGDGVASLLIASADRAAALGLVPQARFVSFATAGASPAIWPVASIVATGRALALAGLVVDDIDHFEINESSAAAVLAWMAAVGADPARVNPTGGSLAWTAPQGAVGAGLFVAAVAGLAERKEQRSLVSVAGEGGVATACVLEKFP